MKKNKNINKNIKYLNSNIFLNKLKEFIQVKRICISILLLMIVAIIFSILNYYQEFNLENKIYEKVGKINNLSAGIVNGKQYINKNDKLTINLEGIDTNYLSNSLTNSGIVIKVGGNVVTPATKVLSSPTSITNGVQYKLTLSGITGNGELSVEIIGETLKDKANNQNVLTTKNTGIIVDNVAPTISEFNIKDKISFDENLVTKLESDNNTGSGHDNNATSWKNLINNNQDGIINGATWTNDALNFDGQNDWVNLGEINYDYMTAEVEFSLNDDTTNSTQFILANVHGGGISIYAENNLIQADVYVKGVSGGYVHVTGKTTLEVGKKYKVRLSYDSLRVELYLNDELENYTQSPEQAFIGKPQDNTVMAIGVNPGGDQPKDGNFFCGKIYQVKIYNTAQNPGKGTNYCAVEASAQDSVTGLKEYQFYMNGILKGKVVTSENKVDYIYKDINTISDYTLEVKVLDKVNNIATKSFVTNAQYTVSLTNLTRNGYDLTIYTPSNVDKVQVPTWTIKVIDNSIQDDLKWVDATKVSDGQWKTHINVSDHNYETGNYLNDFYCYINGTLQNGVVPRKIVEVPYTEKLTYSNITRDGFDIILTTDLTGIPEIQFPTWTSYNGQDDLVWHGSVNQGNGTWKCRIDVSNHKYEAGDYITHVYLKVNSNMYYIIGETKSVPNTEYFAIKNASSSGYDVVAYLNRGGVSLVQFPSWTESGGQDDIIWGQGTNRGNGAWTYRVNTSDHGYQNGQYNTHIYATVNGSLVGVWGGSVNISGSVAPPPTPPAHTTHTWNAMSSHTHALSYTWSCQCGNRHSSAYYIYCSVCNTRKTSSPTLVCPLYPDTSYYIYRVND